MRARGALIAALLAVGATALWIARRPRYAIPLAVAATAGAWFAARDSLDHDAAPIEVLDGVASSGEWLRRRAARDELVLPSRAATFELATTPPRVALAIDAPLDPAFPSRARAARAALVAAWVEPWPADALVRARNDLVPLARAWVRLDGDWSFRGAWEIGAPLGDAVPGAAPPGWLVSGLPQAVDLVVGEVAGAPRSFVRCTWP